MCMTPEEELIKECIESHRRMIKYHRAQIIELSRRIIKTEREMQSFEFDFINKSGRPY